MAYILPTDPRLRQSALQAGSLAAGGGTGGASGSATPPAQSGSGSSYGALRAFFDANKGAAAGLAGQVLAPMEKAGNEAVSAANTARAAYENQGGQGKSDEARGKIAKASDLFKAGQDQEGLEGLVQGQFGGSSYYPAGYSAADAYLLGRDPGFQASRDRWLGVLGALDPSYRPGNAPVEPGPKTYPNPPPSLPGSGSGPTGSGDLGPYTKPAPRPRPGTPVDPDADPWSPPDKGRPAGNRKEMY